MAWSPYQIAIFEFIDQDNRNAIIEAVAGSGKTTTIVEAIKHARGQNLFLAFNKAIAEELKSRGVNARTFHSLTYSITTRSRRVTSVDQNKTSKLLDEILQYEFDQREIRDLYAEKQLYKAFVCKLVGLGKQVGVDALIRDTYQTWMDIIEYHDLELESEAATYDRAIDLASKTLGYGNRPDVPMVDFDDMLYLPVRDGMVLPKFDFVFVDEAQDTNAIQRALLKKLLKPTSRLIAVGDPAQAIYGFRGADSDSLKLIADDFGCVTLPLSVTYRCAGSIVEMAQAYVPHIQPRDQAPAGVVSQLGTEWKLTEFVPDDLVVCRTTKPLIALAYKFLRARIPATLLGRDIGQGLKSLVKKMNAADLEDLEVKLEAYTLREVEKARAKGNEAKVEAIEDKTETVRFLIDSLEEDRRTIDNLNGVIDQLFADRANAVKLATIHKSKGLEAETVYWLNSSQCPARWARKPWQQVQERNLCYVAITRAINKLVLIEDGVAQQKHPEEA